MMKPFCFGRDDKVWWREKKTAEPKLCRLVGLREALSPSAKELLGGEFFLFAFHAHLLELALFGFDRGGDFLLDLGGCFLQLW